MVSVCPTMPSLCTLCHAITRRHIDFGRNVEDGELFGGNYPTVLIPSFTFRRDTNTFMCLIAATDIMNRNKDEEQAREVWEMKTRGDMDHFQRVCLSVCVCGHVGMCDFGVGS
jgi:hypothetical protein